MKVVKPPYPITKLGANISTVFLAGSIEMGVAEDWQTKVEDWFRTYPKEIIVLNPRRDEWDSSWEQDILNPQFYQQVNWELSALEKADLIIMYFSPETKSPISLLELGKFAESGKIIVCCPTGFWRKGNVDIVCERYGIPNYESLQDLLTDILYKQLI
jgi:Nucleoside 2-deoxyribosyltransferase like